MAINGTARFGGRTATIVICIILFVVSLGIRLTSILPMADNPYGWGLKNDLHNGSYHPDESPIFDYSHKSYVFRPKETEYYNYGTVFYWILRRAYNLRDIFGTAPKPDSLSPGDVHSEEEWENLMSYVSESIQWGRYASAFFGALTVPLVYLLLRRWFTVLGSLSGAALASFGSPALVEHSRFMTVDVISLFFITLTILAILRMLRPELQSRKRWLSEVLLAAVLVGFAASTRYSNAMLVFPIWAVLAIRRPKGWWWMAIVAAVVSLASFAATTPGFITDHDYFMSNLRFQENHVMEGHGALFIGRPSGYIYHIELMMIGMSYIAVIVGLLGLFYAAFRKHYWAWVMLAFLIPYWISIGHASVYFLRYGFPLYIGVMVGFAYAISAIQRRIGQPPLGTYAAAVIAFLCLLGTNMQQGILGAYQFTAWMLGPDPRDLAGQYLHQVSFEHPGVNVGLVSEPFFWTPAVFKDADYVFFKSADVRANILRETRNPHVTVVLPPWQYPPSGFTPKYVTYTSYDHDDPIRLRGRTDIPTFYVDETKEVNHFYDWLNSVYTVDKVYGADGPNVHDLQYIRPRVVILKRNDLPW